MVLSKNFTLLEFIRSNKADKLGIDNMPEQNFILSLMWLAQFTLQPARDKFGRVDVTSGYRSKLLNIAINGSKTSQHMEGQACDFRVPGKDLKEVFNWMKNNLIYGQIIYEAPPGREPWIHVSLPRIGKANQQALFYDGKTYKPIEGDL